MENLSQKFIPGIIALLCGIVFIVGREGIEQKIISSHEKFWNKTLHLQSEIHGFVYLFVKFFIIFLGVAFLLAGIVLLYQYFIK